jgi:uncharacterized RDD family membrane protein YckC
MATNATILDEAGRTLYEDDAPRTRVLARRLFAFILDAFLASLIADAVARPLTPLHLNIGPLGSFGYASGSGSALQLLFGKPVAPFWPLVVPIVVAYFIVCEAAFGLTPGKGLAGLRVTRVDGARAGFWPVVVRNLLRPIEAWDSTVWLGGIVILLSSRRQRIGDHLAGTVVADVRSVPASYLSRGVARRRALWCAVGIPLAYVATLLLAYVSPVAVVADHAWTGKTPAVNSSDLTALLPATATVTDRWSVSGPYRQGMLGGFLTYKVRYEVLTGGLHGSRQGHTCYATARLKWANSYSGWLEGWAPYDLNTSCLGSTLHTTA